MMRFNAKHLTHSPPHAFNARLQPARRQPMRHTQFIKPPQPRPLLRPQFKVQILAQIRLRQRAPKYPTSGASRAAISSRLPNTPIPRSRLNIAATSRSIDLRRAQPTSQTQTAAQSTRTTSRRDPKPRQNFVLRLPTPHSPLRIESPDRQSTTPHPHPSSPARSRSAAAPTPAARRTFGQQNLRQRRTGPRAFVQRHPPHVASAARESAASRSAPARGKPRTHPKQSAAPACEKTPPTAPTPHPAAPPQSESASRLGKSYVTRASGASSAKPYTNGLLFR